MGWKAAEVVLCHESRSERGRMTISVSDGLPSEKRTGWRLTDRCNSEPVVVASVSGARLVHYLRRRPSPQQFPNVHAPREAALAEAENRDEVYPRLGLRGKPSPPVDDSGGNVRRAGHLAVEGENDGWKVATSERVVYGWESSEREMENALCASRLGRQSKGAGEYP